MNKQKTATRERVNEMKKRKLIINLAFGIPLIIAVILGAAWIATKFSALQNTPTYSHDDVVGWGLAGFLNILQLFSFAVIMGYYCMLWRGIYHYCTDTAHSAGYMIADMFTMILTLLVFAVDAFVSGILTFAYTGVATAWLLFVIIIMRIICFAVYKFKDSKKPLPASDSALCVEEFMS